MNKNERSYVQNEYSFEDWFVSINCILLQVRTGCVYRFNMDESEDLIEKRSSLMRESDGKVTSLNNKSDLSGKATDDIKIEEKTDPTTTVSSPNLENKTEFKDQLHDTNHLDIDTNKQETAYHTKSLDGRRKYYFPERKRRTFSNDSTSIPLTANHKENTKLAIENVTNDNNITTTTNPNNISKGLIECSFTQTPLLSKIKNPFEDTPDSGIQSSNKKRPSFSNSATNDKSNYADDYLDYSTNMEIDLKSSTSILIDGSGSKSLKNHNNNNTIFSLKEDNILVETPWVKTDKKLSARDIFKKMQENQGEVFEFETQEAGIVLGKLSDGEEEEEDVEEEEDSRLDISDNSLNPFSRLDLNVNNTKVNIPNTTFEILKKKISSSVNPYTQQTQEDGDVHGDVNNILREKDADELSYQFEKDKERINLTDFEMSLINHHDLENSNENSKSLSNNLTKSNSFTNENNDYNENSFETGDVVLQGSNKTQYIKENLSRSVPLPKSSNDETTEKSIIETTNTSANEENEITTTANNNYEVENDSFTSYATQRIDDSIETQIQVPQSIEQKQKNQKLIGDSNNDIHTQSPILNRWLDPSQATLKGIVEENDENSQSIIDISNSRIYKFNEKLKIIPKSQNDKDDRFSLPETSEKHHDSIPDSQEDIKNTSFANTQHIDRDDLDEIDIDEGNNDVNDELNEIVSSYEDKNDFYKSSGMKKDSKFSQSQVTSEITGDTQTPKNQEIFSGSSSDQKSRGDTLRIRDSNDLHNGPGTSNMFLNHDTPKVSKTEKDLNDEEDDKINFNNKHKKGQAKIIYSQIQISQTQVINNGQDAAIPDTLAIEKSSGETIPIDIDESQPALQVSASFLNSEHEDDDEDSDEDDFTKDARMLATTRSIELIHDEKTQNRDNTEHQKNQQDENKEENVLSQNDFIEDDSNLSFTSTHLYKRPFVRKLKVAGSAEIKKEKIVKSRNTGSDGVGKRNINSSTILSDSSRESTPGNSEDEGDHNNEDHENLNIEDDGKDTEIRNKLQDPEIGNSVSINDTKPTGKIQTKPIFNAPYSESTPKYPDRKKSSPNIKRDSNNDLIKMRQHLDFNSELYKLDEITLNSLDSSSPKKTKPNNVVATNRTDKDSNNVKIMDNDEKGDSEDSEDPSHPQESVILRNDIKEFDLSHFKFKNSVFVSDGSSGKSPAKIHKVIKDNTNSFKMDLGNNELFDTNKIASPLAIKVGDLVKIVTERRDNFQVTGLKYVNKKELITCIRGYNVIIVKRLSGTNSEGDRSNISMNKIKHKKKTVKGKGKRKTNKRALNEDTDDEMEEDESEFYIQDIIINRTHWMKNNLPTWFNDKFFFNNYISRLIQKFESNKIFSKCIFCVSIDSTKDRNRVVKLIEDNGGLVLQKGFEEIIHFFDLETKSKDINKLIKYEDLEVLKNYGFAAVISNKVSRTLKYLESLVLNWPILSESFILDTCKNKLNFNAWSSYLLPSGKSNLRQNLISFNSFKFFSNWQNKRQTLTDQLLLNSEVLSNFIVLTKNIGGAKTFTPSLSGSHQASTNTVTNIKADSINLKFFFKNLGVHDFRFIDNISNIKDFIKSTYTEDELKGKIVCYYIGNTMITDFLNGEFKSNMIELTSMMYNDDSSLIKIRTRVASDFKKGIKSTKRKLSQVSSKSKKKKAKTNKGNSKINMKKTENTSSKTVSDTSAMGTRKSRRKAARLKLTYKEDSTDEEEDDVDQSIDRSHIDDEDCELHSDDEEASEEENECNEEENTEEEESDINWREIKMTQLKKMPNFKILSNNFNFQDFNNFKPISNKVDINILDWEWLIECLICNTSFTSRYIWNP